MIKLLSPALIERIRSVVAELEDRHVPNSPEKPDLKSREEKLKGWTPNHVLINEYQAGQGIAVSSTSLSPCPNY
jgi:alkylated DNA repair dioxygenase AlkB